MIGILLINLGTPDAPTEEAVRVYLNEFLSDPRVITLPTWLRNLLVQRIILKKRPKKSAHAYQQIWTDKGSPLLVNSQGIRDQVSVIYHESERSARFSKHAISLGMRYGNPSIESAITKLQSHHCDQLIIFPLFPQRSNATTESAIDEVKKILAKKSYHPALKIIQDFHDQDFYINAFSKIIEAEKSPDHFLLMSFHGLPARHCDSKQYQAQCHKTAELVAKKLNLSQDQFHVAFQSRLGLTKWISPYTDHVIKKLRKKGITKLSVVCPSFVADCIETLEEINIRLRNQWMQLGGESFHCISCLNQSDDWIRGMTHFLNHTHKEAPIKR